MMALRMLFMRTSQLTTTPSASNVFGPGIQTGVARGGEKGMGADDPALAVETAVFVSLRS